MDLVEVNIVGAELAQAVLNRRADVLWRMLAG